MKPVRLTLRAEKRLGDISGWTIDKFGVAQADAYEELLLARVKRLACGEAPEGRSCALLVSERTNAGDLRYVRAGRHFVIFVERRDELIVLDFVHGSRDLDAILSSLSRGDKSQNS